MLCASLQNSCLPLVPFSDADADIDNARVGLIRVKLVAGVRQVAHHGRQNTRLVAMAAWAGGTGGQAPKA